MYSVFLGQDSCKNGNRKCDRTLMFLIRLLAAVIPIVIAFFISNLVEVLQISGLFGFILCFILPTALQLQSTRVCKKIFSGLHTVQTAFISKGLEEHRNCNTTVSTGAEAVCSQEKKPKNESSLYMTPYSTRILSHPVAVTILGTLGIVFFLATIASLIPALELKRVDIDEYCFT